MNYVADPQDAAWLSKHSATVPLNGHNYSVAVIAGTLFGIEIGRVWHWTSCLSPAFAEALAKAYEEMPE